MIFSACSLSRYDPLHSARWRQALLPSFRMNSLNNNFNAECTSSERFQPLDWAEKNLAQTQMPHEFLIWIDQVKDGCEYSPVRNPWLWEELQRKVIFPLSDLQPSRNKNKKKTKNIYKYILKGTKQMVFSHSKRHIFLLWLNINVITDLSCFVSGFPPPLCPAVVLSLFPPCEAHAICCPF